MILVDANLLLYAYDPRAGRHESSRAWFESVLSGSEFVRFAWVSLRAFARISTNPRVFERPLSAVDPLARRRSGPAAVRERPPAYRAARRRHSR